MSEDDPMRRLLENPAILAALGVTAVALFVRSAVKTFSTPEGRRSYRRAYREGAVAQRERDKWHERNAERYAARRAYFEGRGGELFAERAEVRLGPEKPFADARMERLPAGFRHTKFEVRSRRAGARVQVDYDLADRDGRVWLAFDDGRTWGLTISAGKDDLRQWDSGATLPDVDMARFACRLLAAPGSSFRTITLIRPEQREIREEIWREHVAKHPELAEEEWPF